MNPQPQKYLVFWFFWALHRGFREQCWKDFGTELEPAIDWTQ